MSRPRRFCLPLLVIGRLLPDLARRVATVVTRGAGGSLPDQAGPAHRRRGHVRDLLVAGRAGVEAMQQEPDRHAAPPPPTARTGRRSTRACRRAPPPPRWPGSRPPPRCASAGASAASRWAPGRRRCRARSAARSERRSCASVRRARPSTLSGRPESGTARSASFTTSHIVTSVGRKAMAAGSSSFSVSYSVMPLRAKRCIRAGRQLRAHAGRPVLGSRVRRADAHRVGRADGGVADWLIQRRQGRDRGRRFGRGGRQARQGGPGAWPAPARAEAPSRWAAGARPSSRSARGPSVQRRARHAPARASRPPQSAARPPARRRARGAAPKECCGYLRSWVHSVVVSVVSKHVSSQSTAAPQKRTPAPAGVCRRALHLCKRPACAAGFLSAATARQSARPARSANRRSRRWPVALVLGCQLSPDTTARVRLITAAEREKRSTTSTRLPKVRGGRTNRDVQLNICRRISALPRRAHRPAVDEREIRQVQQHDVASVSLVSRVSSVASCS